MDGIVVSNHGGRQVDGAVGTMDVLPAIVEAVKGYEAENWYGLASPAGTPKPIVDRLYAAIAKVLQR